MLLIFIIVVAIVIAGWILSPAPTDEESLRAEDNSKKVFLGAFLAAVIVLFIVLEATI
jgi:hypothetical protein